MAFSSAYSDKKATGAYVTSGDAFQYTLAVKTAAERKKLSTFLPYAYCGDFTLQNTVGTA